jgi:hypothetical protein
MEARSAETTYLFRVGAVGYLGGSSTANSLIGVRPIINLNPNVSYVSGDGRLINPYRLALP